MRDNYERAYKWAKEQADKWKMKVAVPGHPGKWAEPHSPFMFLLSDMSGNALTGASPVASYSLDANPFKPCGGTVREVGNGWYAINFLAEELAGNCMAFHVIARGAMPLNMSLVAPTFFPRVT